MSPRRRRALIRRAGAASGSNCRWCSAASGQCPASPRRRWRPAVCSAGSRPRWSAARIPRGQNMPSDNRWDQAAPIRYPDPDINVLDPRFQKYVLGNAAIERIAGGCRFTEGPVWFGDGRYLLWSDIPNDRIMKWEEETGAVSTFRRPSNYANGNTRDRQGRLVTGEIGAQPVTRTE